MKKNRKFKMEDIHQLARNIIQSDEINGLWAACSRHVEELEDLILEKENIAEEFIQRTIDQLLFRLERYFRQ
jgi:hypothetical protein